MIKANKLKDVSGGYISLNAEKDDTLELWQDMMVFVLGKRNDESYGLPLNIYKDEVKSGGLLSSKIEPCVIIENGNHPNDYFKYVLLLHEQRGDILFDVWNYGNSRQFENEMMGKNRGLGGAVRNAVFGSKDKWQEESQYYDGVLMLIRDALNVR